MSTAGARRAAGDAQDDRAAAAAGFASLLRWAAGVAYADVPEEMRVRALLVLADDVAAMLAVRDDPQVAAVRRTLVREGQPAEATVFCGGRLRGERAAVAAANGAAGDWGELDEGYRPVTCHAGLYVLPALLAEAESAGVSTERVIAATVVAYEVVTRVARAWRPRQLLVHPHALLCPLGAATAAALVRGLSADACLAAAAAGATTAMVGPFDHAVRGALVRNVWPGFGAFMGVHLAAWAEAGVGGLADAPHQVLAGALGAAPDPGILTEGLGGSWAIADGYHKRHACCQYAHAAVEALCELRVGVGEQDLARVREIRIETHALALALDDAEPATTLAAKFSLPHLAAAALTFGEIAAEASSPAALRDPRLRALRAAVRLAPYEGVGAPPHDRPARVVVTLVDGAVHEARCLSAKGSPDDPLSRDELLAKVARIAAAPHPRFGDGIRALIDEPRRRAAPWPETLNQLLG